MLGIKSKSLVHTEDKKVEEERRRTLQNDTEGSKNAGENEIAISSNSSHLVLSDQQESSRRFVPAEASDAAHVVTSKTNNIVTKAKCSLFAHLPADDQPTKQPH